MSLEIAANPALPFDRAPLKAAARAAGLDDHMLFRTSGTSAPPRWAALSRAALAASARMVVDRLEATSADRWLGALPLFHVGGYGVRARADLLGAPFLELEEWSVAAFFALADREAITITSLVPTQLHDLVRCGRRAPATMRCVLVGGAALDCALRGDAEALGWPVRESYGLTEAASTVAIEGEPLAGWELRIAPCGAIQLRGAALMDGYLVEQEGEWSLLRPFDADGWFDTGDRGRFEGRRLQLEGRANARLKILGERVDLDALQALLEGLGGSRFALAALPDERRGHRLVMVGEVEGGDVFERYNAAVAGFERAVDFVRIDRLPRSGPGKLARLELAQILDNSSEA